ncbi:MAG: 50S ribosomal protein L23 [archaeon]
MSVVKHPLSTEKSIRLMESQNKLVFVVERTATRNQIKDELQKLFNAKIVAVNTHIAPDGVKRAYVQFHPETPALDVATKLGLM